MVSSGVRDRESKSPTVLWYSGVETLSVEASDTLTSASFDWKQLNANVVISGLEEAQNNGSRQQMHNLLKARIQVCETTLQNTVAAALFYSNTENGGKAIGGLQHLVADLPTSGTVGGINRANDSWWRNQYYDFSANAVTASATTIQHAMNLMHTRTLRGTDKIDMWLYGETYWNFFEESLQPNQRFMSAGQGEVGFDSYKYKSADVFFDSNCAATRGYGLNSDYIHFRPYVNRNFVTLKDKVAVNQDATVVPMFWMGNMTVSNASLQAVIVA